MMIELNIVGLLCSTASLFVVSIGCCGREHPEKSKRELTSEGARDAIFVMLVIAIGYFIGVGFLALLKLSGGGQ